MKIKDCLKKVVLINLCICIPVAQKIDTVILSSRAFDTT
jgi:hypothetical protein